VHDRRARAWMLPPAVLVLVAAMVAGCGKEPLMEKIPGPGTKVPLTIDGKSLLVEVAMDEASRKQGLMHRESLPKNEGMLFIWPEPSDVTRYNPRPSFWMRNTSIPLSLAFIDDEGKILQIEPLRPYDERSTMSKYDVRFALEVNQGWFEEHGIGPGSRIENFRVSVGRFRAQ